MQIKGARPHRPDFASWTRPDNDDGAKRFNNGNFRQITRCTQKNPVWCSHSLAYFVN